MARILIIALMLGILGTGWYMSRAGVWGVSNDLQTVRTGSAGVPYYGTGSVK